MDVPIRLDASLARIAEDGDLPRDLVDRPRRLPDGTGRVQPWPQVPAHGILRPPPRIERAEAIFRGVDLPVELRGDVVEPAFAQPLSRVGEGLAEGVEPVGAFRITRAPDTKGADAHGDPWLGDVHALIELGDEIVDVVAAPIVSVRPPLPAAIPDPRRVVRKIELAHDPDRVPMAPSTNAAIARPRLAIGVEEIVEVDAVDVIALHDVDDRRQHRLAGGGNSRVDPLLPPVSTNPIGVGARDVIARRTDAPVE